MLQSSSPLQRATPKGVAERRSFRSGRKARPLKAIESMNPLLAKVSIASCQDLIQEFH